MKKIEAVIQGRQKDAILSPCLWGFSLLYAKINQARAMLYDKKIIKSKRLDCKVISVGNICAGGTGKTPMTLYLADLFKKMGKNVAVISRGYKGQAEKSGGIVSNGRQIFMGPKDAGDEPFMMADILENVPILVGKNRFKSGICALKNFDIDVILLDDGFQHLKLERDLDLLLLDSRNPLGNGHVLPRGPLREPVSALNRADALILTHCESQQNINLKKPVFKAFYQTKIRKIFGQNYVPDSLKKRRVFAFSGIAHNEHFFKSIQNLGGNLAGISGFADHHAYSKNDIERIIKNALASGADCLATTEKDAARLSPELSWPLDFIVMGIDVSFGSDEPVFVDFLRKFI